MACLFLHTSSLKRLFAELAGIVSESPGSFQRGIVVVQTVSQKVRLEHFSRSEQLQL
jgi:hypothetical protein